MFIDRVTIQIKAGRGGDGKLSFRHLKSRKGGPDGGDGGRGGNVVICADHNTSSLYKYRSAKLYQAAAGEPGGTNRRHGKNAEDLVLIVAPGTQVIVAGELQADLADGEKFVVARGGDGGFGNAHFVSSTRQAPRFAELGEVGEEKLMTLELKLIAQVGLIGLPNAGKSTLLAAISNAKPEIADYAFTTLTPNLGMVEIGQNNYLFADIPGLIKGASQGKGLGDEFLRHVERTHLLVHMIELPGGDWVKRYQTIRQELSAYSTSLMQKPELVVLTKSDREDAAVIDKAVRQFTKLKFKKDVNLFIVSAATRYGISALLYAIAKNLAKDTSTHNVRSSKLPVIRLENDKTDWQVAPEDNGFVIYGSEIEKLAKRTNFDQVEGLQRLRRILVSRGIARELNKLGIKPGTQLKIAGKKFKW